MNWSIVRVITGRQGVSSERRRSSCSSLAYLRLIWKFVYHSSEQKSWLTVDNNSDGLIQERHNSIANTLELCLSCINPSVWCLSLSGSAVSWQWTTPSFTRGSLAASTSTSTTTNASCARWAGTHFTKILWVDTPNLLKIHGGYIDGLVQERRNSIANALELRLSCNNPSIWNILMRSGHNSLVMHWRYRCHVQNHCYYLPVSEVLWQSNQQYRGTQSGQFYGQQLAGPGQVCVVRLRPRVP